MTSRQWPAIRYHHVSLISSKGTQVKLISAKPTNHGKVTQFSLAFVQEEQGMIITRNFGVSGLITVKFREQHQGNKIYQLYLTFQENPQRWSMSLAPYVI